jgi:hypothetical protein
MKHVLMAATLVLVAGTTVGCGGGDKDGGGAPAAASEKDFCDTFTSFTEDMAASSDKETSDQIKTAKDAVAKLADVGTPKDIPADARDGFEIFIDTIKGIDDNASEEDLQNIDSDLSEADNKKVSAFTTYYADTCSPTAPTVPSESPS